MAKQYEVYVQGKYYKTFETDDSMALVWKITDILSLANATTEIPWYDRAKPSAITVAPYHGQEHSVGVTTIDNHF